MGATIFWLAAVIVFAVVEAATVGLASIWFAVGGVAALLASLLSPSIGLQIGVFAVVSVLSMAVVRPLAKKYMTPTIQPTNADRILGREGVVIEEIDNLRAKGRISVLGGEWAARNEEDAPLSVGTKVTILRIEGVKVYVRPADPAGT